jgi:hypothetical protein
MSESDALPEAREQFCDRVRGKTTMRARHDFDVEEYNAYISATDALVNEWAIQGQAREVLRPLLDHDEPAVRGSAASYLLRNGATEEALTVLNELAENEHLGRAALDAEAALLSWEAVR